MQQPVDFAWHLRSVYRLSITLTAALALVGCAHDRSITPAHYSGRHLFEVYCSGCHGLDGHGRGSVQPYIAARPPDLTQISTRNGGAFPKERVFRTIDGQFDSPAPNTRHMPIWGYDLFTGEGDDETAHQQVLDMEHRIVTYVESLQEPPPVAAPAQR
jgi:hypothetical protein